MKKLTTKQIGDAYKKAQEDEVKRIRRAAKQIKLLHPKEGDILVVSAEAGIDLFALSRVLTTTKIQFALVAPKGRVSLAKEKDILELAIAIKKHGKTKTTRKTANK
jgi:hypothetical protein